MDGVSFDCFDEVFTFGVPGSLCNWESCWEFWDKVTNGEGWATLVNRPTCKGKILSKADTQVTNTPFTVSKTSVCTSLTSMVLTVVRCAIYYHLYKFKHMKNTHGGMLSFWCLYPKTLLKVTLLCGCFSCA